MLIIKPHKQDSPKDTHYIDRLLKKFKYKIKQTKVIENLWENKYYVKPSTTKRHKRIKAIKTRIYKDNLEN